MQKQAPVVPVSAETPISKYCSEDTSVKGCGTCGLYI